MCFRYLICLAFCVLIGVNADCDLNKLPATWASILAKDTLFNAWEPSNLGSPSFCYEDDFFTHTANYHAHVNLADPSAKIQKDVATNENLKPDQINCGKSNTQVVWCLSHCQNKTLENLIITSAVTYGALPLSVAEEIYEQLNSPKDMVIAALHIDQNTADIHVDYDYFDDKNFCSVYLKVKKPSMFPYALLLTAQKTIV